MEYESRVEKIISLGKALIEEGKNTQEIKELLSAMDLEVLNTLYKIPRQNIVDFLYSFFQTHQISTPFLDAGCGDQGDMEQILPDKIGQEHYIGLDHKQSDNQYPRSFVRGDMHNLPFKDASFGAVLCSEVLEHVKDVQMVVSEFARVVKLGGALILTLPGRDIPNHEKPYFQKDYRRFSHTQVRDLLRNRFVIDDFSTRNYSGLEINIFVAAHKKL